MRREEYLRKNFAKNGLDNFTPSESLELLLGYCFQGAELYNVLNALLEKFYCTQNILNAGYKSLMAVPGMTKPAAVLINLLPRLYRTGMHLNDTRVIMSTREEQCRYFLEQFRGVGDERFKIACLDGDKYLITCITLSTGTSYSVSVDLRELLVEVAKVGSVYCVASHNHPGGRCLASDADIRSTAALQEALKSVGVTLLDHIVVAREGALSVYAKGEEETYYDEDYD